MKKKQFVYVSMAATALASCMTSCIENEEGEGLKALREGQSEYWIAKGEAEKTLANADLKRAEGEAALNAAKAKVEEAAAKAKEAAIALTEAEAKAKQIENDYNEKMNALEIALETAKNEAAIAESKAQSEADLAKIKATSEKEIAKIQNDIELQAANHKIAMDALEQTRVNNEKALVAAQATLVAQKEAYEEAILKAATDLATAKKNQATSMASIENELAKLEETKRGYEIQLEKLKITNDGLELDNERLQENLELRKATEALTTEINKVNQELTMYNDVIAKIDAAYAVYVTAQKDLIDKNATYAKAVDTYSLALINALNGDIDDENTKALAVYNKETAIKDAEHDLLVAKRAIVSNEVAIESAEKALAKFQETEKADKEALAEDIAEVKEEIEQLKKDQTAKQVEIDQATIAQEVAYDELTAADDKLKKDRDEKIEAIQKAVWAMNDEVYANGYATDNDKKAIYSEMEQLNEALEAAQKVRDDAYAANERAKDAEYARIAEVRYGLNLQKEAIDEEIKALNDQKDEIDDVISDINDKLHDTFQELAQPLVDNIDAQEMWNDEKVEAFTLTVGTKITKDVEDFVKNTQDTNGQLYFALEDGKLSMAEAYTEWLTNAALTSGNSYSYNYQITGTSTRNNNYSYAYMEYPYEYFNFEHNVWTAQQLFYSNPIYKLRNYLSDAVSSANSAFASAASNIKYSAVDYDYSTGEYKVDELVIQEALDVKKNDTRYTVDDTYTEDVDKLEADYNTALSRYSQFKTTKRDLDNIISAVQKKLTDLKEEYAKADTEMGIAFKNAIDAMYVDIKAQTDKKEALDKQIAEKNEAIDDLNDKIADLADLEAAADKAQANADKEAYEVYRVIENKYNDDVIALNVRIDTEMAKFAEARLEYAKAYAALEELAAYEEAIKAVDEVSAEMTDIDNNLKYAKALAAAYAKVYGWQDYSEYNYLVGDYAAQDAETIEQAIAAEERGLKEAIEDAERDLEVAMQTVEAKEQALKTAQDDLTKTLNSNEYEKTQDAVADAEDVLAKAKLDLEGAERAFEQAEAVYNAAIEAWNALLPDAE